MTTLAQAPRRIPSAAAVARALGRPAVSSALLLVVTCLIYFAAQPHALSPFGINNLLDEYTALALAAVGECFVIITGGFDLSVGAVMAFVNVILAVYMGSRPVPFIILSLAIGSACGLVNGLLVAALRVPSIIATLAMMFVWGGAALFILPQPGGTINAGFAAAVTGNVGPIPVAALILVVAGLLGAWILKTRTGGWLLAAGASESAAHALALPVRRLKILAYLLAGLFYGAAGVFFTAESGSGDPTIGQSFLLEAFAAVAVGGTIFGGGRGSAVASIFGALITGVINDLLQALGVSSFASLALYGAVLFLAVFTRSPRMHGYLREAIRNGRPAPGGMRSPPRDSQPGVTSEEREAVQ